MPLLDVHGQPVNVIDRGEGDAVVFLHAFPLQAAMWDYQFEALDGSHRCIAIDLPGFGESPPPAAPDDASMQGWADLVAGVLDQLGVPRPPSWAPRWAATWPWPCCATIPSGSASSCSPARRARSDDPSVAQRRTAQQDQLREGTEARGAGQGDRRGAALVGLDGPHRPGRVRARAGRRAPTPRGGSRRSRP